MKSEAVMVDMHAAERLLAPDMVAAANAKTLVTAIRIYCLNGIGMQRARRTVDR
jgi:hypothetical protein